MSPSDRGADGRDEPTAGESDPRLKYIAPMPASRRRPAPSPDEDPTAGYAVAQDSAPPQSSYVRPAAPAPSEAAAPAAPIVAEQTRSTGKGGWLAPLAVILVSIAALAAVYFVTQGGGETRQAAPSNPPTASAPSVAPTQPSPTQSPTSASPTPSSSSATESTPAASEPAPSTTQAAPPSTAKPKPTWSTPSKAPRTTQPARLPSGVKRCGTKIGAGATTTCGFAKNVAVAVRQANKTKGAFHVGAWSPTTKLDYRLRCTAAPVTVCTGGRAAVIYVAR